MNWTGGRRARHNSNSALNTSARLQKQYFARVRMARESGQSASNLVRSSSPIGLVEIIRPLKPKEGRDQSAPGQVGKVGLGLEPGFGPGNNRPLWGPQISRPQEGPEGRNKTKVTGDTARKKTGHRSRVLALDLGDESVEAPKKLEVLKQKKNLLLQEGDWLGTKQGRKHEDDEVFTGNDTRSRGGTSQLLEEEFDFESRNEDDGAILLECTGYPPESLDGGDSIFLEVGNAQLSTSRKKPQSLLPVQEQLTQADEGGSENDTPTSDSMLLSFEDGVLPLVLGSFQREPTVRASRPLVDGEQVENSSNSEPFTWSSSSYAGRNGRNSTPELPAVRDFVNVDDIRPQSPLGFSPGSSPHFHQALDTEYMTSRQLHEFTHSEDKIRNSSMDAFASSLAVDEGQSDDGQWIDMILNEYYCGGAKGGSHTDPNTDHEAQEQHGAAAADSFTRLLGDMGALFGPIEGPTAAEGEGSSWRDIGLQGCAMRETPQGGIREQGPFEGGNSLPCPQAESTMDKITVPEGRPQPKIKHKVEIDLDDNKAWRDFVHQLPVKEDWGEQNEEGSFKNSNKRRKRFRSSYQGESEDDYILLQKNKHQAMVEIPSSSSKPGYGGDSEAGYAIDLRSNAATAGTRLSSPEKVDLDCSVLGNISPSPNRNIDSSDGCSSIVANVSSSSVVARLSGSDPVETESTESIKSSSPSKALFTSALRGRNKPLWSDHETKRVMWVEGVKEKESSEIAAAKRAPAARYQPESAAITKAITGLQKAFEGARRKGVRDEIEDW